MHPVILFITTAVEIQPENIHQIQLNHQIIIQIISHVDVFNLIISNLSSYYVVKLEKYSNSKVQSSFDVFSLLAKLSQKFFSTHRPPRNIENWSI